MAVLVVNMIPLAQSGESNQDSEPNVAVNPANPQQIVGSAFTPDPMGGTNAPIFVSTDGGNTWVLNSIVPGLAGNSTSDITVRYSGTGQTLFAGILRRPGTFRLNILRTNNPLGAATMTVLVDRNQVDQPYVQAATAMGGAGRGNVRVYVGNNDFNAPLGRTATVDQSLDAATAPPPAGFTTDEVEERATSGQDGPPIRPAIHPDGTIYAVFYGWRAFTGSFISGGAATTDVVVVRDDNWGIGANPFTALTDPSDNLPGRLVATGRTVPWMNANQPAFGQERFVGSNITIAVDPRNSFTVYIAWADRVGATGYTLHVRRSTDRGQTWSAADLRTITNATNPALAINSRGKVGFLYQQLTGTGASQRWVTHFERTTDDWVTTDDLVLANVPANAPAAQFTPYIGDYVHLMAIGKHFYGIFSANNTPNMANFPNGIQYQRNANFTTNTLLALDGMTPVLVSIDPFFFKVTEIAEEADFYVRDWTANPTSRDTGLEPSTNPVFYATSDVWNRRTNAPGGFNANDQPLNEDPQMVTAGDNFGFARIHRNAGGTVETVTAHFLYSEFGTGSNYQNAGTTPDPTISFAAGDLVQTMSSGYQWQLPVTTSTHICFAVELSTPTDPIATPSLLGRTPGWPTTDLMVINDNNKAQRNMHVYRVGGTGRVFFYATIHNAAVFPRNLMLRYDTTEEIQERLPEALIEVIGGDSIRFNPGDTLVLPDMQPGENRWVGLTFDVPEGDGGELLPVFFHEMVETTAVNGFAIAPRPSPLKTVVRDNLELHAAVFIRMATVFGIEGAEDESQAAEELLGGGSIDDEEYIEFLQAHVQATKELLHKLLESQQSGDPFNAIAAVQNISQAVEEGAVDHTVPAHSALLHKLDAFFTMLQKSQGDLADILQNVTWQIELYTELPQLRELGSKDYVVGRSQEFSQAYEVREVGDEDYPSLIDDLFEAFKATAEALEAHIRLEPNIAEMRDNLGSPTALQKAHRGLLLNLQSLVK